MEGLETNRTMKLTIGTRKLNQNEKGKGYPFMYSEILVVPRLSDEHPSRIQYSTIWQSMPKGSTCRVPEKIGLVAVHVPNVAHYETAILNLQRSIGPLMIVFETRFCLPFINNFFMLQRLVLSKGSLHYGVSLVVLPGNLNNVVQVY